MAAIVTLQVKDGGTRYFAAHSRQFRLGGRAQDDVRLLIHQAYQHLRAIDAKHLFLSSTLTGSFMQGLLDEARIEAALMMLPHIAIEQVDADKVSEWNISSDLPEPENAPSGCLPFVHAKAIDVAQYAVVHLSNWSQGGEETHAARHP